MIEGLLMLGMFLVALFLILLVLVQRGKGGGLAGALGGMGGQSAFGTKAGDLFTKITIVTATIWILLCIVSVKYLATTDDPLAGSAFGPNEQQTVPPGGASGTPSGGVEGAPGAEEGEGVVMPPTPVPGPAGGTLPAGETPGQAPQ